MIKEIKGDLTLTINIKAGDIYAVKYNKTAMLNIVNYTDGAIFISEKPNFDYIDNVGNFLTVTDGNSYNDYMFYKKGENTLYIKADADGYVCLVRKQW